MRSGVIEKPLGATGDKRRGGGSGGVQRLARRRWSHAQDEDEPERVLRRGQRLHGVVQLREHLDELILALLQSAQQLPEIVRRVAQLLDGRDKVHHDAAHALAPDVRAVGHESAAAGRRALCAPLSLSERDFGPARAVVARSSATPASFFMVMASLAPAVCVFADRRPFATRGRAARVTATAPRQKGTCAGAAHTMPPASRLLLPLSRPAVPVRPVPS